ncbi:MAG: hypothetical protein U0892_03805 [Pirellulales bacterium]
MVARRLAMMIVQCAAVIWASPYSLLGISIGVLGLVSGGKCRIRSGALEFYGGFTALFVRSLPTGPYTLGMTLGHTIIGQTAAGLDVCCLHERVHVKQFERWGPFMGPAYLLCSAVLWLCGKDAYRDNPFEVEAYDKHP